MTYEHECSGCGAKFERQQKISDKPNRRCVRCGKNTAKRLISGGGAFVLLGGGWADTGYSSTSG